MRFRMESKRSLFKRLLVTMILARSWKLYSSKMWRQVRFAQIYLLLEIVSVLANESCSETSSIPKYYLMERCHRSKLGAVAKANFTSLTSCQRFGAERKGLALNFSPPEVSKAGVEYSCEILKCAEVDGGLSLANDTAFDYYSLYGRPLPNVNSTCVPSIGMFHQLPKRLNYTEARAACRIMTGVVPDVTSEQRTDALAQLLAGISVEAVFAGLRRRNTSVFVGENGESLDCSTFRAWAPGHPRKNFTKYDCMLITRRKTWLSAPCTQRLPGFCELLSGGPYKKKSIFASRRHHVENNTETQPNSEN